MNIQNPEILIAQKAKAALSRIEINKEFISYLNGLPSNIIQNGLIQTLAFIKGKKSETRYQKLYEVIDRFFKEFFRNPNDQEISNIDTLKYLTDNLNSIQAYIFYQKGLLSFSIWLKRFANAFYEE